MGIVDDEMDTVGRSYPARHPLLRFNAIGEAWGLLMRHWPIWVLAVLIVLVCNSALSGLIHAVFRVRKVGGPGAFWTGLSPGGKAFQFVISEVVNGLFLGGMFRMACQQIRGRGARLEMLFSVLDVLPQLVLGSILYGLAVFLGFCALVVPGFIVSGVLMFTLPLIVDGGLDATDALAQSWHALKQQWLVATIFHIAAGCAAALGLCFCGVGFLLTAPLYAMSIAVLYRDFFMIKGPGAFGKPA
jgi:hypothetical protein